MADAITARVTPNGMTEEQQKEHDEKMMQVADNDATRITSVDKRDEDSNVDLQQTTNEGDDTEGTKRPDDIPEKFWDAEKGEVNVPALLKAQQDAESALRKDQNQKPTEKEGEGDENGDDDNASATQENVVADASAEFAKDGKLSDATYESLSKVGLSKDMVDSYIAGQQAQVAVMETAVYGPFDGSAETYEKAANWAAENLTEDEISALDVQIQSNNPAIAAQGAKALAERYNADADITPDRVVQGGNNQGVTGEYYKSSAEMQKDMSDPRYKSDKAFRDSVASKIARADKAGIELFV